MTRVIAVRIDGRQAARGASQVKRALADIQGGARATARGMGVVNRAVFSLRGAFAGLSATLATRSLVNTQRQLETTQRSLKAATGSAEAAADAMQFLSRESERLGVNLETTERGFSKIAAAARGTALEGAQAREIFLGVTEATAALGLSAEQTQGALTAIEQIISKGTVSAEELRGQLGERIPGAFQIAARAVGVTTEQLDQLLRTGQLAATDFLPLFGAQLREELGGAAEEAATSLQGSLNRLDNAFLRFKRTLVQADVLSPFQDAVDALTRTLSDPDFLRAATRAASAFATALRAVAENLDVVAAALAALAAGVGAALFTRLAVGAVTLASGLVRATTAASAAAAAAAGLGRVTAGAAAGMASLRAAGFALGGPAGILAGLAAGAATLAFTLSSTKREVEETRESLDRLGRTQAETGLRQLESEVQRVQAFLDGAQQRLEQQTRRAAALQALLDNPNIRGRDRAGVPAERDRALANIAQAETDIDKAEAALQRLNTQIENFGTTATTETDPALQALRDELKKLVTETDDAKTATDDARESLRGLVSDLDQAVATYGATEAGVLRYRLTTGDLADEVRTLGAEGEQLADRLITLQTAYDKLAADAERAETAQQEFEDLFSATRTEAEALAIELERLDTLQAELATSGALTEQQLAQLPEVMDRARESAKEMADGAGQEFDALKEFATQAARAMQSAFSDLFFSLMQGEFDNLEANFKRTIDRMVANYLSSQLLQIFAGQAGTGGLIGAIGSVAAGQPQRRYGGSAMRAKAMLVGEEGPEIFYPPSNGEIIPARTVNRLGLDRTRRDDMTRAYYPARAQGGAAYAGQPISAGELGQELFVGSAATGARGGASVVMNITTPDVDSFRASQGQLLAEAARLMQGARQRNG